MGDGGRNDVTPPAILERHRDRPGPARRAAPTPPRLAVETLSQGHPVKIVEVEIYKDEDSKFLKGMFRFTHYGKK